MYLKVKDAKYSAVPGSCDVCLITLEVFVEGVGLRRCRRLEMRPKTGLFEVYNKEPRMV